MSTFVTRDGTSIYFKDWGSGKPVLFSHGWPLDADMWDSQMEYLASRGYRAIAFDRRGFGRSSQPWSGYDYDTFADDIAQLIEHLDLRDVTLVGFSMGGGDVSRYIARHGSERVAGLVLLGAVTPVFGKRDDNPEGVDLSVFESIRAGLRADLFVASDTGVGRVHATLSRGRPVHSDGTVAFPGVSARHEKVIRMS